MAKKKLSRIDLLKQDVLACVPDTWLDELLTGPKGIKIPARCPQIERLLNEVRAKIEGAFRKHARSAPNQNGEQP